MPRRTPVFPYYRLDGEDVVRVAVLGAGLQGACVALELAMHGIDVDLFDRETAPLTGASANNEGKLHLGFVYANDPSMQTARLMVRGALTFEPLLRRWVGDEIDHVPVSAPFEHAVHRESLIPLDDVEAYLGRCQQIARQAAEVMGNRYFGRDPLEPVRLLSPAECSYDDARVAGALATPEVAIEPEV